jgi:cell fate regulator YaaT (PSP1 superfamily)
LCCSTWLTDFRSVPQRHVTNNCPWIQKTGWTMRKLKCCLNYELDTYMDALKHFPDFETKLVTEKGDAIARNKIFSRFNVVCLYQ